jgi:hypothetical protein
MVTEAIPEHKSSVKYPSHASDMPLIKGNVSTAESS